MPGTFLVSALRAPPPRPGNVLGARQTRTVGHSGFSRVTSRGVGESCDPVPLGAGCGPMVTKQSGLSLQKRLPRGKLGMAPPPSNPLSLTGTLPTSAPCDRWTRPRRAAGVCVFGENISVITSAPPDSQRVGKRRTRARLLGNQTWKRLKSAGCQGCFASDTGGDHLDLVTQSRRLHFECQGK